MAQRWEVFLSHFIEEEPVAECVQDYLKLVFGEGLQVFRSSDDGSIGTGKDQYTEIMRALRDATVYIVLVSKYSAQRPWLNFEAGYGKARGVDLFPVLIRDTRDQEVPTPLSEMELRPLAKESVVDEIISAIKERTGRTIISENTTWFLAQLNKKEVTMPKRELSVIPFRCRSVPNSDLLRFELRYNGPRAIKLVKVWAEIPWDLMHPNMYRHSVTGHLVTRPGQNRDGRCLRLEVIANTNPADVRESGAGWQPLLPHLNPTDSPTSLEHLQFVLSPRADDPTLKDRVIRCQVIAEDGDSPIFEYQIGDIEIRSDCP